MDLATRAANKLFVNGVGTEATRLVLVVDNPNRDVPYLDIGGWCKQAVIDVIAAEYEPVMKVLREALVTADQEASIAHDAIWSQEVESAGILHDNERADSAQSAIWRLHKTVREALQLLGGG